MLKRKCEQEGDVAFVIDLLMKRSAGIEVADSLSIEHIKESINNLRDVTTPSESGREAVIDFTEKHAQSLIAIALKVKTRKHWVIIEFLIKCLLIIKDSVLAIKMSLYLGPKSEYLSDSANKIANLA